MPLDSKSHQGPQAAGRSAAPFRSLGARLLTIVGAACLGAAALALVETLQAGLGLGAFWAVLGLVAPLATCVGLGVALAIIVLGPAVQPKPSELGVEGNRRSPALLKARIVVHSLAGLCWLMLAGQLTLQSFISEGAFGARAAGATLTAVGLGVVVVSLAERAVRAFAHFFPRAGSGLPWALGTGLVWAAALVGLVGAGETSGAGGALRVLGVLRREELQLQGPALLLLVAACASLLPWALPRIKSWVWGLTILGAWAMLVPAYYALQDFELGITLQRSTFAPHLSLAALRRLSDSDGDGFSPHWGGGDCSDQDARIFPGAQDVPGNGIDEDCSGEDRKVPVRVAPAAVSKEPPAPARRGPLNILLITIDTLRPDLGYAGYSRPISPNIDALATRSVVYERAYSLASYTGKSLAPMLIGRYPSETHRGWMHFNRYPKQDVMLQERLQQSGFTTLSFQGHWYFKANTGLGRGFDTLDLSGAPKRAQGEGDRTVNSDKISDAAIAALGDMKKSERFFMWIHYLDPHAEYVPHAEFEFGTDQRALYDGEVAFTDHHLGRVLKQLADSPFSENTAVILTSDHGEAFREHGMVRHGFELWEELVRVPLIVYVPGHSSRRIKARRSTIDIAPTIMDLATGKLTPEQASEFSGQSLVPELASEKPAAERPIFLDMPAGPYNSQRQALISKGMKLITSSLRPLGLYDLNSDPEEKENLTKDKAKAAAALAELKAFRDELNLVYVKPR